MDNFDLICTATLRPELIKRTFDSHIKYLFKDNIKKAKLHCNIDMIGSDYPDDTVTEIYRYFSQIPFRDINLHVCKEPSFSRAFYWLLGQIDKPLTFNLEEDWELSVDIDFEEMVELFEKDSTLAHLRLSSFKSFYTGTNGHQMKTWNKFIDHNGKYFTIERHLRGVIGWAGHPSLNATKFLLAFASILDKNKNHEKQIKGHRPILLNSHFGVFHPFETGPALKDIGRNWMKEHGYGKKGTAAFFTEWEKTQNKGRGK